MNRPDARDRVVDAAVSQLHQRGLTVALDGISLEEAIADSGVARATAYRRWPNRAQFTQEVLTRAVRSVRLEPETPAQRDSIRQLVEARSQEVSTEAGLRTILVEVLRIATDADYQRLSASQQWRDYLALRVTCEGIADQQLREALISELQAVQRGFLQHRARIYAQIPRLFGHRIATPLHDEEEGFALVAELTGALMSGLILGHTGSQPLRTFRAQAFGSAVEAEWTTASYALTGALLTHLERDPGIDPDPQQLLVHLDGVSGQWAS